MCFVKECWKLNTFPYLIDFLPFLLQVLSLYVYAILLKEFRHSMVLGKSNTKASEKYCRAPVVSGLYCVVVGSISSGGYHGIHCLWDPIRSRQQCCGSVCHAQVFTGFSGHGNSIYYIIPKHTNNFHTIMWFQIFQVSSQRCEHNIYLRT